MNKLITLLFSVFSVTIFSQELKIPADDKYLEDQLYFGLQYISNVNENVSTESSGLPYSINAGFIKDIPINKNRNIGLGIGLGYSLDIIKNDISAIPSGNSFNFVVDRAYSNYTYTQHNAELPIEFRWRTSTSTKFSFWRIYIGASYIRALRYRAKFENGANTVEYKNYNGFNKENFSVYTSFGYGTWNFHIKYYLQPFFNNEVGNANFNALKLGLMFYLL